MRKAVNYLNQLKDAIRSKQQRQSPLDDTPVNPATASEVDTQYRRILQTGADYASLLLHPGYKLLLDDLEREADKKLAALRSCLSTDPAILRSLHLQWTIAEEILKSIQVRAQQAVEDRKSLLAELSGNNADAQMSADTSDDGSGTSGLDFSDTDWMDNYDLALNHVTNTQPY